jgi:DNA polymerase-3 subunit alpha (Gram-positive type)
MNNLYPSRILAIDVETTGLNSQYDYITQIGAVVMEDGNIAGEPFYTRVQPNLGKAKISLEALAVQSGDITTPEGFKAATDLMQAWVDAPSAKDVAALFATWLGTTPPPTVAFNAGFDMGFLSQWVFQQKASFGKTNLSPITICPMVMAKAVYPGGKQYNLDAVLILCGLPQRPKAHDALQDAILAGQAYFVLREKLNG